MRDGESQPEALNLAAQSLARFPVRFVPQSELPTGVAYERTVRQCVPTRDGLHDFFNGLAGCNSRYEMPDKLHLAQIAQTGIQPVRGPARDALTVFDENAAFLQAPDALWDALVAKDWQRLFVDLRPLWRRVLSCCCSATPCWRSWFQPRKGDHGPRLPRGTRDAIS